MLVLAQVVGTFGGLEQLVVGQAMDQAVGVVSHVGVVRDCLGVPTAPAARLHRFSEFLDLSLLRHLPTLRVFPVPQVCILSLPVILLAISI